MKKIKRIDKHKLDYYDDVTRGLDVIEQNFEELERRIDESDKTSERFAFWMLVLLFFTYAIQAVILGMYGGLF